jgi:hypothetical protein
MTGHVAGPRLELAENGHGVQIDTIRALFTYSIATVVVIGGGVMLFVSRVDTGIDDLRVVMAGFIGSALTFVFSQEVQTRTARQAAASTAASTASTAATLAAANSGVGPPVAPPGTTLP